MEAGLNQVEEHQAIEAYISSLSVCLRKMEDSRRRDVTREIRAHLEHQIDTNRLSAAFDALGQPNELAGRYLTPA